MKVKLLVSRTGANGAENRGYEINVSPAEAKRMVDAGQCEIVRTAKAERAVPKSKAEKATR